MLVPLPSFLRCGRRWHGPNLSATGTFVRPRLFQSLGLEVRPTCISSIICVCAAYMRQFSSPSLVSNQLLAAVLCAFVNVGGGAWRQELASRAGAQKLEAISSSSVYGELVNWIEEKPQSVGRARRERASETSGGSDRRILGSSGLGS